MARSEPGLGKARSWRASSTALPTLARPGPGKARSWRQQVLKRWRCQQHPSKRQLGQTGRRDSDGETARRDSSNRQLEHTAPTDSEKRQREETARPSTGKEWEAKSGSQRVGAKESQPKSHRQRVTAKECEPLGRASTTCQHTASQCSASQCSSHSRLHDVPPQYRGFNTGPKEVIESLA